MARITNIFKKRTHPLEKLSDDCKKYCCQWSVVDPRTGKDIGEKEGCGIIKDGKLIDITGITDIK